MEREFGINHDTVTAFGARLAILRIGGAGGNFPRAKSQKLLPRSSAESDGAMWPARSACLWPRYKKPFPIANAAVYGGAICVKMLLYGLKGCCFTRSLSGTSFSPKSYFYAWRDFPGRFILRQKFHHGKFSTLRTVSITMERCRIGLSPHTERGRETP